MVFHGSLSSGCFLFSGNFRGYAWGFRGSESSPFPFEMESVQFTRCFWKLSRVKNVPRQLKCKHTKIRIQTTINSNNFSLTKPIWIFQTLFLSLFSKVRLSLPFRHHGTTTTTCIKATIWSSFYAPSFYPNTISRRFSPTSFARKISTNLSMFVCLLLLCFALW